MVWIRSVRNASQLLVGKSLAKQQHGKSRKRRENNSTVDLTGSVL
jgi:hypothetical protein